MTTIKCPLCGNETLESKEGEYHFAPPPNIPGGTMVIPNAAWHACSSCGEVILPYEVSKALDAEVYRRLGLLTPAEIRQVRQKTGLSATEMAKLLGVVENRYIRWEDGRSIQNKSNDTLIRRLDTTQGAAL